MIPSVGLMPGQQAPWPNKDQAISGYCSFAILFAPLQSDSLPPQRLCGDVGASYSSESPDRDTVLEAHTSVCPQKRLAHHLLLASVVFRLKAGGCEDGVRGWGQRMGSEDGVRGWGLAPLHILSKVV